MTNLSMDELETVTGGKSFAARSSSSGAVPVGVGASLGLSGLSGLTGSPLALGPIGALTSITNQLNTQNQGLFSGPNGAMMALCMGLACSGGGGRRESFSRGPFGYSYAYSYG